MPKGWCLIMNICYNAYGYPEQPKIYLANINRKLICPLNGIQENTCELTLNLNNTFVLSFTVDRYLNVYGNLCESNGYNLLEEFMRIYVENIGWFIMKSPQIDNSGNAETKTVTCESLEIEFINKDLVGFKINCGTTDSYEMLVEGNVEDIDGVEFAKKQIKFCDKENPKLSLLHILLNYTGLDSQWKIGYIDPVPKVYTSYKDGEKVEEPVQLKDEIGQFDIDSQGVYSFFTQDVAKFFNCMILFDIENLTINAYRVENLGKDTNIVLSFRNLQNSNSITVEEDSIYTRYHVYGSDNLSIEQVNFGSTDISNLSYYMNTKNFSPETITKYKEWYSDMKSSRYLYADLSRKYNEYLSKISDVKDRVPLDDCSTEWFKFEDDELLTAYDIYVSQKEGYEGLYLDENKNFDQEALDNSEDADDYYQIKDVIIPSIEIEMKNRKLDPTDDQEDYITSYQTNWKLYGIDELEVKISSYQDEKKVLEDNKYNVPYNDKSGHTQEMHTKNYERYLEVCRQLKKGIADSCAEALAQRKLELSSLEREMEKIFEQRATLAEQTDQKNWKKEGFKPFTKEELNAINHLYKETDYENENMLLTSSDNQVTSIDERLKLLDAAEEDLAVACQPQYIYSTELDNFLALIDYQDFSKQLVLGNYIYLATTDETMVKLRVTSIRYNPLLMDNNLSIEFSNMLRSNSKRNDFVSLLDLSKATSKNSHSGTSNNSSKNEGVTLTDSLIRKIISSVSFTNKVSTITNLHLNSAIAAYINVKDLEAEMIKATDVKAENGFFQYLQSALIAADKIVAGSGEFTELKSKLGMIDSLISGTVSSELGHIIHLTAENVSIDEAVIKRLIAAQIMVSDLKAGDISTNSMNLVSDDGGLKIVGNTMQFYDKDGHIRIQIGRDETDNFTFTLYSADGKGILIDENGIKESAIDDGLIKSNMIGNKEIKNENMDWASMGMGVDDNGTPTFDITQIYMNDKKFGVEYTVLKSTVTTTTNKVDDLSSMVNSISIIGEQAFIESSGAVTPSSITLTVVEKNHAIVDKWYINDTENTSFVSSDKKSITIPSSYMFDKKSITIKALDSAHDVYDLFTLYHLIDGSDAIVSIITSDNGFTFKNSINDTTVIHCKIYKGSTEVEAKSYTWMQSSDNSDWNECGSGKSITVPISGFNDTKRIKCIFEL